MGPGNGRASFFAKQDFVMSVAIKLDDGDIVSHTAAQHTGASSKARLVSAMEEVVNAMDAGEPWDRASLLMKYHDIVSELTDCLSNLDFIYNVAPQLASEADPVEPNLALAGSRCECLGDFRIVRELGRGGMGVVYEAEQLSIGRRVALKVLPFAAMLDKQQLNRFKNEARAAGTLDHSNIVPIYFVGCERGVHFYAMQLIEDVAGRADRGHETRLSVFGG
jgi:eukaryotic-like serine/threonine-protein kinase